MKRFCTSAQTSDIGISLPAAKRGLMANPKYSHPLYWGAFSIVGDARKSALATAPMQTASK